MSDKIQITDRYDDIILLPHHQSKSRPHMSLADRAAQFSPFAALTGYEEAVKETARQTVRKVELSEEMQEELQKQLYILQTQIEKQTERKSEAAVTYFLPDEKKEGGAYRAICGNVKRIDAYRQVMILTEKKTEEQTEIPLEDICQIEILDP